MMQRKHMVVSIKKVDPEFGKNVKNHFYLDDLNTGV